MLKAEGDLGDRDAGRGEAGEAVSLRQEIAGEDVLDLVFAHRGVDGDDARDLELEGNGRRRRFLCRYGQNESGRGGEAERSGEQCRPGKV